LPACALAAEGGSAGQTARRFTIPWALGDAVDAERPRVVIDLRGVSFLDSTMLRVLIQGQVDTVARGARLALIRPNATLWRVFVLTGLSHSFNSFGRLDEPLASFALRP
jgi:anti-anti-sigma factor